MQPINNPNTKLSNIATEYIGSKKSLISFITNTVNERCGDGAKDILDLFSGTGVVSAAFKSLGYSVTANDHLSTCFNLTSSVLLNHSSPLFSGLKGLVKDMSIGQSRYESVLDFLNNLDPIKNGFIYKNYSPATLNEIGYERRYFSEINASRIDTIRQKIEDWKDFLNAGEYALLISDLIKAASSVSNVAGTYGCYLKDWKPRAMTKLTLRPTDFIDGQRFGHSVWSLEANKAISNFNSRLVYADPPYTKRQYAAYYHVLETIVRNDSPILTGTTGLRDWTSHSSKFCYKRHAEGALEELLRAMNCEHFFMSYNEDGQMSHKAIMEILSAYGDVDYSEIQIKRYRSSSKTHRGPCVTERLYHLAA